MAAKPAAKKAPAPDSSSKKKIADEIVKSTKGKYSSVKRAVREDATSKEMKRTNEILERAGKMRAGKNIYSTRWYMYERVWKMVEEERPEDEKWRANLPDTMAVAAIKTAQAAFIDSEVVPVIGREENDDLMRANDQRDLYVDIAKKGDQKFELYLARLDAMKLGTGFLFVYPEKDTRIRWEIDKFNPETDEIEYTRKSVDVFSDPKTIRVSPYLVLVDEQTRANFRATCRDAIMIEIVSREEAQLRYAHYFGGVEQFNKRIPTTQSIKAVSVGELQNRGIATTANNNTRHVSAHVYTFFAPIELAVNMVEILHYFCVRPEDSYEVLINGSPVFVKTDTQPSPMPWIHKEIPLVPIRWALYSGDEFWGQGMIEASYSEIRASRQYREMMNDRQRLSLFTPVFSDITDEIDKRFLKLKPLSVIRTRGGVPHQYKIPGVTSADFQIAQDYQVSMKRATGVDEAMIGGGNSSLLGQHRLTATAIAFMRQAAFMRLKDFQFLYKQALLDEVRLKFKLFEQYYDSPLKRAPHEHGEEGLKELASQAKQFSIKIGNVYKKKNVSSTLFTGPIEHIDLDMQVLMPLTPVELITKWSQVIRDTVPFVQAGILDLDLEKMMTEYLSALDVNIDKLRKDPDDEAIMMADGEHELLTDANTSQAFFDKILQHGTPDQFLTASHLKRHQQLLRNEDDLGPDETRNLVAHIAADTKKYEAKMKAQAAAQSQQLDKLGGGAISDLGAPGGGGGGGKPPAVSMNYKDAPEDVQRQIEEEAGFHPSEHPQSSADNKKKRLEIPKMGKGGGGAIGGGSPDDQPGMMSQVTPSMNG